MSETTMPLQRVNEIETVSTKILVEAYLRFTRWKHLNEDQRKCLDNIEKEIKKREREIFGNAK